MIECCSHSNILNGGSQNGCTKGFYKIQSKLCSRSISRCIERKCKAEIQAIGAGALNQAVKAIAIARGFVAPHGMDLICVPAFIDITIDGGRTHGNQNCSFEPR